MVLPDSQVGADFLDLIRAQLWKFCLHHFLQSLQNIKVDEASLSL